MKDVEKFRELLEEYESYLFDEWVNGERNWAFLMGKRQKYDGLIKMYEELEEQNEKTVIKCKNYELDSSSHPSYVYFENKSNVNNKIYFEEYEEKDGMLITDDFIFVKESE